MTDKPALNLQNFDFLRGLLILYILASHGMWLLWEYPAPTVTNYQLLFARASIYFHAAFSFASTAAVVFFVISGFFIHLRASQQLASGNSFQFDLKAFFKSRCLRMLPPYYLSLFITVMLDSIGRFWHPMLYYGGTSDRFLTYQFSSMQYSASSVFSALLLFPTGLGLSFGTNAVLWFFTFQIIYYLLYPPWLALRKRGAIPAYISGIIIALLAYFLPLACYLRPILMIYPCWLAGAAIAEIACKKRITAWACILGAIVAILGFMGIRALKTSIFTDPLQILFHGIFATGVVMATAACSIEICQYKLFQLIANIGRESYTIYLCHFPMVVFIAAWAFENLKTRPSGPWLFAGGAGFTLYACHLCYVLCERRFQQKRLSV